MFSLGPLYLLMKICTQQFIYLFYPPLFFIRLVGRDVACNSWFVTLVLLHQPTAEAHNIIILVFIRLKLQL